MILNADIWILISIVETRKEAVEKPALLVGDVAQPERPLRAGKPGPRIRGPERR